MSLPHLPWTAPRSLALSSLCVVAALSAPARAETQQPTTALSALIVDRGAPQELGARFERQLPEELRKAGFSVLDQRLSDVKLAERPELLSCQTDVCLREQADLLGVLRILQPMVRKVEGGLGLSLALFEIAPKSVDRIAVAATVCPACRPEPLKVATAELVAQLLLSLRKAQRAELSIEATPPDARVLIDGADVGRGARTIQLPPGVHRLRAEAPGGFVEQQIDLVPRERRRVALHVIPVAAVEPQRPRARPVAIAKWTLAAVGLVGLVSGTVLWALDGSPRCDRAPGQVRCPEVLDTAPLGIGLLAGGATALGASAVLFGIDYRRSREGGTVAALLIGGRF